MRKFIRILLAMAMCGVNTACGQTGRSGDYPTVSPLEFLQEIGSGKDAYVLDVRTPQEFAEGHLEGAHNLDWLSPETFQAGLASLPKDRTIYVYCRSGGRSAKASRYLAERGYRVVNLAGGFSDLERASRR